MNAWSHKYKKTSFFPSALLNKSQKAQSVLDISMKHVTFVQYTPAQLILSVATPDDVHLAVW